MWKQTLHTPKGIGRNRHNCCGIQSIPAESTLGNKKNPSLIRRSPTPFKACSVAQPGGETLRLNGLGAVIRTDPAGTMWFGTWDAGLYRYDQSRFQSVKSQSGPSPASISGIEFNPDGNSIPEDIPRIVAKVNEGYDLVIGSRYRDGAKSDDDDWLTAAGNWMFTRIVNLLFGTSYTDVLVGFRAYRRAVRELGVVFGLRRSNSAKSASMVSAQVTRLRPRRFAA